MMLQLQAQGVHFFPLVGRHIAEAMSRVVKQLQKQDERALAASLAHCPATFYLAHQLSSMETSALQGDVLAMLSLL